MASIETDQRNYKELRTRQLLDVVEIWAVVAIVTVIVICLVAQTTLGRFAMWPLALPLCFAVGMFLSRIWRNKSRDYFVGKAGNQWGIYQHNKSQNIERRRDLHHGAALTLLYVVLVMIRLSGPQG